MRIVIAGGSGFLGTALVRAWQAGGASVQVLTRRASRPTDVVWDPSDPQAPWTAALEGVDVVVNLAGDPLERGRWTDQKKTSIRRSRIGATHTLATVIGRLARPPRVFLSGSAIGIYGPRGAEPLTETAPAGADFLASVCAEWEAAAQPAASTTRLVFLRTGLVLDRDAGALPRMALPVRFGAGGPLGSGQQYWSWIHLDDWVGIAKWIVERETIHGPVNLTAPGAVTNRDFVRVLGRTLHRPAVLPAPGFALRLLLGEMADALILNGQRVVPDVALQSGFAFRFPELGPALAAIYGR